MMNLWYIEWQYAWRKICNTVQKAYNAHPWINFSSLTIFIKYIKWFSYLKIIQYQRSFLLLLYISLNIVGIITSDNNLEYTLQGPDAYTQYKYEFELALTLDERLHYQIDFDKRWLIKTAFKVDPLTNKTIINSYKIKDLPLTGQLVTLVLPPLGGFLCSSASGIIIDWFKLWMGWNN